MKMPMPKVAYRDGEIDEITLEMFVRVYKEQFEAVDPEHELPALSDEEIAAACADSAVTGGPQVCAVARYVAANGGTLPTAPVVSGLTPATVVIGAPSFTLSVGGTGFRADDVIVFNGFDEPTTFVSDTELTTGVNMPLWAAPATVPVLVRNAIGMESAPQTFTFTAAQ